MKQPVKAEPKAAASASPDQMADNFVKFLIDTHGSSHEIARVSSWVGLIVCGIVHASHANWNVPRSRQLHFEFEGRSFKANYDPEIGTRGGIEIVEALPRNKSGLAIACITNLAEAAMFHGHALRMFQEALGLPLISETPAPQPAASTAPAPQQTTKKKAAKKQTAKPYDYL